MTIFTVWTFAIFYEISLQCVQVGCGEDEIDYTRIAEILNKVGLDGKPPKFSDEDGQVVRDISIPIATTTVKFWKGPEEAKNVNAWRDLIDWGSNENNKNYQDKAKIEKEAAATAEKKLKEYNSKVLPWLNDRLSRVYHMKSYGYDLQQKTSMLIALSIKKKRKFQEQERKMLQRKNINARIKIREFASLLHYTENTVPMPSKSQNMDKKEEVEAKKVADEKVAIIRRTRRKIWNYARILGCIPMPATDIVESKELELMRKQDEEILQDDHWRSKQSLAKEAIENQIPTVTDAEEQLYIQIIRKEIDRERVREEREDTEELYEKLLS